MVTVNLSLDQAIGHFPNYIGAGLFGAYLARYELFKKINMLPGHIIECGVAWGGGLTSWLQFCALYEHLNLTRLIYGFDTFNNDDQFPSVDKKDGPLTDVFDKNKEHLQMVLNEIVGNNFGKEKDKAFLVAGDACETIPKWCKDNPHALIALLYLDFDAYLPTSTALRWLTPRIPKGGIVAFDELNYDKWPGETIALMDEVGIKNVRLQKFPWCQTMAYYEVE